MKLLVVIALLMLVGCVSSLPVSTECEIAVDSFDVSRPYAERHWLAPDGTQRKWLERLPTGYRSGKPVSVVFDFHGSTSSAEQQYQYSQFGKLADQAGVIMIWPDANIQFQDPTHELASYWDHAWEAKFRVTDDDINFINHIVSQLKQDHCLADLFAAGMSAGGDIVSALACEADSPFSAFASVTYRYYLAEECRDAPSRPHISFHGEADEVVPLLGSGRPWFDPPVAEVMDAWAKHNRCPGEAVATRISGEVIQYSWSSCQAPVVWYLTESGGHTWPGAIAVPALGKTTEDISASQLIWQFFGLDL